jgi:transcriptional regulator with XRE-family HTH domain
VRSKALEPEQNEALRTLVRKIIDDDFAGKVSVAAKSLGVSHSLIFEFLDGRRGLGMKALEGLANYTGRSIDGLLGRASPEADEDDDEPLNMNLRGWRENEPEARRRTGMPDWAFQRARRRRGLVAPSEGASVQYIIDEVAQVAKYTPIDEQVDAVKKQLDRELAAQDKAAATRSAKKKGAAKK